MSQQVNWIDLKRDGGPSNQPVYSIKQDLNGFIWLGTGSGLYRFDGKNYKRWKGNLNSKTFPGLAISRMELKDNNLWMIVDKYLLVKFNTESFKYSIIYKADLNIEGSFEQMCLDSENNVIVSTRLNRIIWINSISGQVSRRHNFIKNLYIIQSLFSYKNKLVLGTRTKSVCLINRDGSIWMTEDYENFPYPGYSIEHIIKYDSNSVLFCSWDNAIHLFDLDTYKRTSYVFDNSNEITFDGKEGTYLCRIDNKEIWIGTKSSGVFSFNTEKNKFTRLQGEGYYGNKVFCVFQDKQKRVWVGTDEGLNLFDPQYNQFKTSKIESNIGVGEVDIYDLKFHGDTFFLGTNLGLLSTDLSGDLIRNYTINQSKNDSSVYSLIWDYSNNIYYGNSKSLYKLNIKTNKIESGFPKFNNKSNLLAFNPINLLSTRITIANNDLEGKLLIACPGYGILTYEQSTGNYFAGVLHFQEQYGAFVKSVIIDKDQKIWAADEENGIFEGLKTKIDSLINPVIDRYGDTIGFKKAEVRYFNAEKRWFYDGFSGLNNNSINFLVQRNDQTFWVGTKGSGLFHFDPKREPAFIALNSRIENPVSLFEDNLQRLWLIEDGQLFLFDVYKGLLYSYGREYGLPVFDIHSRFYSLDSNTIAVTAGNRIIRFNPDEVRINNSKAQLHIVSLSTIDNQYDSLIYKSKIELHESENGISFKCAALDYSNDKNVRFVYLLEGYNSRWVDNGSSNTISFSKLPAGNYTLKVKAQTKLGFLISDVLEFPIRVIPYWYNTMMFKMALSLLLIAIAFVVYRLRLQQILRLQNIRDKIARDLHDDIGSTLGAINLYTNAAKTNLKKGNEEKASAILDKIGQNSREMSQHMSDIIWSVNPKNDELDHLINRIQKYADEVLSESGFNFILNYDPKAGMQTLGMAERRNIYLILKECLHNSLKYSDGNEIKFNFKLNEGKLLIAIQDNGKGFNMNEISPFNGNGFRNMKSRVDEINGKLEIVSSPGNGTEVNIILV
ncbi:MAG: two-component regulator propeller domain-containing protein [Bacteroidia bacterium]